jgi:rod shape-determining protein MreD
MIRRWFFPMAIVATLVIIQSTWLDVIKIYDVKPDLSLIVIVYLAFKNPGLQGQSIGFFSGLIQDSISMAPLGLNALIKSTIALIANLLSGKFYIDKLLMPALLGFIAILMKAFQIKLLSLFFGDSIIIYRLFNSTLWIEAVYTAILSPVIFILLSALDPIILPSDIVHE